MTTLTLRCVRGEFLVAGPESSREVRVSSGRQGLEFHALSRLSHKGGWAGRLRVGYTATAEPGQSERRSRQSALVLVTGPMKRSDRVATLDEAKAQFQMSWDTWKAWAKMKWVA